MIATDVMRDLQGQLTYGSDPLEVSFQLLLHEFTEVRVGFPSITPKGRSNWSICRCPQKIGQITSTMVTS